MADSDHYRHAGVDLDAAATVLAAVRGAIAATHGPQVLSAPSSFGGLFAATDLATLRNPVLVASTDGVGTKTMLAAALDRHESLGLDLVHHCVNDILTQGARPLFLLDYLAMARLEPLVAARIIGGVAEACRGVGCALLGGETAELPGVYASGQFDLVGTIVGQVDHHAILDGHAIAPGHLVVGLRSSGLHTNGYSLARQLCAGLDLSVPEPALGASLGDALLAPHRCYLADVERLWAAGLTIHAMAHITGGGLIDNPARILPDHSAITLEPARWTVPPLFGWLKRAGQLPDGEMARVFNLGLGMLLVMNEAHARLAVERLGDAACIVGSVVEREDGPPVRLGPIDWGTA